MNTYIAFFKAHERVVTVLILAVTFYFLVTKVLNHEIDSKTAADATAQAQVKADTSATAAILATIQQERTANTQLLASMESQIQSLVKQQASAAATIQQAPAPVVAKALGGESTPDGTSVVLPISAARVADTAEALLPLVRAQLADTQAQLASETSLEQSDHTAIVDLQKQLADTKAADADQISLLKTQKKKSWLSGFKWGFITGAALGAFMRGAIPQS